LWFEKSLDILIEIVYYLIMIKEKDWVILLKTDPTEGEIIRGKLESAGVEVMLEQEAIGKIYGLTVDGLGEVKLYVREDALEGAKKILEE